MKSRLQHIAGSQLVRNTLKLSSSNVVMILLPLIVTPVLSRLYTTEDYGEWGVFSSVFMMVSAILFLSYEHTLVKTRDEEEVPALCLACLMVAATVIAGVTLLFVWGKWQHVAFLVAFPHLPLLIALLVLTAFSQLFYQLLNRFEQYAAMAVGSLVQGIGQAVFRLSLFALRPFNGLILGNVLAQLLTGTAYLTALRTKLPPLLRHRPTLRQAFGLMKKYRKFPLYDAPGLILETSIGNMALIVLSLFFPKGVIGCYSMIFQFLVLPITIIGSAMSKVYYKELSVAAGPAETAAITKKVLSITFVLSLLPICFIALGGDQLIAWYLGSRWQQAGHFALFLSIMSVPLILTESLLPLYRVIDRQHARFGYDLASVVLGLGGMVAACVAGCSVYEVLLIYVLLYAAVRFLLFLDIKRRAALVLSTREKMVAGAAVALSYTLLAGRIISLFIQNNQ